MSLPRLSVHRPIATAMFFLAVVLLGLLSLQRLPVDLLPVLNYPRLLVQTRLPNAAPEEVAELVTRPVEQVVSAVSGVKRVVSRSREGVSLVTIEFYWGENMDYAALSVREKLDEMRVLLPEAAQRPRVLRLDPSAHPIMQVAVTGSGMERLTDVCRQVVRRRLEQLPGVALVEVVGGVEPFIEVQIDPDKLLTQNINTEQIVAALKANNLSAGGTIKKGRYRFAIRIEGELHTPEDVKQVAVLNTPANRPVFLGDIARIHYVPKDPESLTRLNGQQSVGLLITKEAGSNTVLVTREVRRVLRQLEAELETVHFFMVSQQAAFIEESIRNVFSALIGGGILAFLSLFLFLRNFRHPLNIAIAMPVSIIATFICMQAAGVSLNMISLGGLALGVGMLVDNSIVVLENIFRIREEGKDWIAASIEGAREVAMPVTASTLTTCAVFLPIIYVEGIAGQLFRDQSLTVAFSLLASLVVALTLLPALASRFRGRLSPFAPTGATGTMETVAEKISRKPGRIGLLLRTIFRFIYQGVKFLQHLSQRFSAPFFRIFDRGLNLLFRTYHRSLEWSLSHKPAVLGTVLGLLFLTVVAFFLLDRRLLPPLYPDEVELRIELPPDATLFQSAQVVAAIEEVFTSTPTVESVFSRIGSQRSVLQALAEEAPYRAILLIKRSSNASIPAEQFPEWIGEQLPREYQYQKVFQSSNRGYAQWLGLEGSDVQVDVRGAPYPLLLPIAEQLQQRLASMQELRDVHLSYRSGGEQYRIRVDRDKAALYGVTVDQIANSLQSRLSGVTATRVKQFDRTIDVMIRAPVSQRDSWEDLYRGMLNVNGNPLPLKEVIRYQNHPATEEILRQDQQETIRILADISHSSRRQAINKIRQLLAKTELPEGIQATLSGQETELQRAFRSIRNALLLSVILVFMILAAQFESFRYPFLILLAVPFGIIGAIWLLLVTGNSLNIISGIGMIVLSGVVVNDAIIKVDFINQARARGTPLRAAILEAGAKRFRPILITTITTVAGLLPLALAGGSGAELRQPLAIAIIGGLSLATVLTLIVIPVLYEMMTTKVEK